VGEATRDRLRFIMMPARYGEAVAGRLLYEQPLADHYDELIAALHGGGARALAGDRDEWEVPHLAGRNAEGALVVLVSLMHDVLGGQMASVSIASADGRQIILVESEATDEEFGEDCYQIAALNSQLHWRSHEYDPAGALTGIIDWQDLPQPEDLETFAIDRLV
jgi:hypothetical protein